MALVSDVYWICPGCGSRETAQVYRDYEDPPEFPLDAIPGGYDLSWNPPCKKCGEYELRMPKTIKLEIKPVNKTIDGTIDKEKEKLAHDFLVNNCLIAADNKKT